MSTSPSTRCRCPSSERCSRRRTATSTPSPASRPTGILRALWTNIRGGDIQQGGSTITQQYAKNAYLTQERTFTRKIKEIFISVKLSQQRSKDEILEDYLNTIYFGRGA